MKQWPSRDHASTHTPWFSAPDVHVQRTPNSMPSRGPIFSRMEKKKYSQIFHHQTCTSRGPEFDAIESPIFSRMEKNATVACTYSLLIFHHETCMSRGPEFDAMKRSDIFPYGEKTKVHDWDPNEAAAIGMLLYVRTQVFRAVMIGWFFPWGIKNKMQWCHRSGTQNLKILSHTLMRFVE